MRKTLKETIENMTPRYQEKLAHMLYMVDDIKFSLAVIDKDTKEIILQDTDAAPLAK